MKTNKPKNDSRPLVKRITQGRMHAFPLGDLTIIGQAPPLPGAHVAHMVFRPDMKANAELIVEAFNTTRETGRTPRQLVEFVKELIAHLDYTGWGDSWERECSKGLQDEAQKFTDRTKP